MDNSTRVNRSHQSQNLEEFANALIEEWQGRCGLRSHSFANLEYAQEELIFYYNFN